MLVCVLFCAIAHETAGAARTRSSLRPPFSEGRNGFENLAQKMRRDREGMFVFRATSFSRTLHVIASAAKQSSLAAQAKLDCFVASLLAMTLPPPSSSAKADDPVFQRRQ